MVSVPNYCSSGLPGVLIESVRNVHVDSLTLVVNCLAVPDRSGSHPALPGVGMRRAVCSEGRGSVNAGGA